jgi:hypothetical protein
MADRDLKAAQNFFKTEPIVAVLKEIDTALDLIVTLANDIKAQHDAHCADATAHNSADVTNVTTADDAANAVDLGNAKFD